MSAIFRACPNLKLLDFSGGMTDISEIGCCPDLTSLSISGRGMTDISAIGRGCPELTSLDITRCGVTDLTEIGRGCSKLASLSIDSDPEQLAKIVRAGSLSAKPLQLIQSLDFECVGAHVSFVLRARSLGATTRSHTPSRARSLAMVTGLA